MRRQIPLVTFKAPRGVFTYPPDINSSGGLSQQIPGSQTWIHCQTCWQPGNLVLTWIDHLGAHGQAVSSLLNDWRDWYSALPGIVSNGESSVPVCEIPSP